MPELASRSAAIRFLLDDIMCFLVCDGEQSPGGLFSTTSFARDSGDTEPTSPPRQLSLTGAGACGPESTWHRARPPRLHRDRESWRPPRLLQIGERGMKIPRASS